MSRRASLRPVIGLIIALVASLLPLSMATAVGLNLAFTTVPPNPVTAGSAFPVQVHVQDNAAAALPGVIVTLDIPPANNPGGATLVCAGGTSVASNGARNAVFASCTLNRPGAGYVLRASASGATSVGTGVFTVQPGAAAALAFVGYPATTTPASLSPQPAVAVVDAQGNLVTSDHRTIVLSINRHRPTFTCAGGLSKAAVNGVAQFEGCVQTDAGTGYRLTADDGGGGLRAITGPNFTVTATGTQLQFCWGPATPCRTTPPTDLAANTAFSLQPSVRVLDAAGNLVTGESSTIVTLNILAGTPTSGAPGVLTCSGGLAVATVQGIATFGGCQISVAGTGYRLNATSSPARTPAASKAFSVLIAGAPTKLAFISQPPAQVAAGAAFPTPILVSIQASNGTLVTTGIAATVQLGIAKGTPRAAVSCTSGTTATTLNGVATFTGCSVNLQGTGYTLIATAIAVAPVTPITPATSQPFTVVATAVVIVLSTLPASGVIRWGDTVVLNVHLASIGAGRTVQLQVSRDLVHWSTIASLTLNGGGDAAFPYRPSDNRYYRVSLASGGGVLASLSNTARVVVRQLNLLRPTNSGRTTTVAARVAVTFTSTVRPARPELPRAHVNFVVYRLIRSTWTVVLNETLGVNTAGQASLRVTFSTRAKFYVRSQAVPTTLNANSGWSPPERYHVI